MTMTPGPWKVWPTTIPSVLDEKGNLVAVARFDDACAIAALPELVEHAEWLAVLIKDHLDDPDEDTKDGLNSGMVRLNVLLAKIGEKS